MQVLLLITFLVRFASNYHIIDHIIHQIWGLIPLTYIRKSSSYIGHSQQANKQLFEQALKQRCNIVHIQNDADSALITDQALI